MVMRILAGMMVSNDKNESKQKKKPAIISCAIIINIRELILPENNVELAIKLGSISKMTAQKELNDTNKVSYLSDSAVFAVLFNCTTLCSPTIDRGN